MKKIQRILIPLPSYGFDPSEVAIPWKIMFDNGFVITFATPNGEKASADNIMLTGNNLGFWKFILKAKKDAVNAYSDLENDESFCTPLKYNDASELDFDAVFLPGGHDKGVREYLESKKIQDIVVDFFKAEKPVGAICHGVILVARSINPETGKSVIYNYKTTALLKSQELLAYKLTKSKLKDYYLTYPTTVEDEVKSVLICSDNFIEGPTPILRDSKKKIKRGFVVKDKNYLSSRWPGDVYHFSQEFIKLINKGSD